MPSLNMSVQMLKLAILPLDLTCSGPVNHSGEILTTGTSHGKKPDRFSLNDDTDVKIFTLKHLKLCYMFRSSDHPQGANNVHC